MSAGKLADPGRCCSTLKWVVPESNQTSSVSVDLDVVVGIVAQQFLRLEVEPGLDALLLDALRHRLDQRGGIADAVPGFVCA